MSVECDGGWPAGKTGSGAPWSVMPILLKPDALEGAHSTIDCARAADFAAYLSGALEGRLVADYLPLFEQSLHGARRALEDLNCHRVKLWWLAQCSLRIREAQEQLHDLHCLWASTPGAALAVTDVINLACQAIGYPALWFEDRVLTRDEYYAFYGGTDEPEIHKKMQPFLVGQRVRFILLCGRQLPCALHTLKVFVRGVLRYPTAKPRMENWIHVTDPDAANFPSLLRMYANSMPFDPERHAFSG